ncbi:hypothetical protein SAMD00019534_085770, partial [Acytostelium subglobosum LB1]|uniref:hypothetical protein n=1 Tax=Acytostelium subglobosum LB1 TaxID=1410327 RepID=UPI00064520FA
YKMLKRFLSLRSSRVSTGKGDTHRQKSSTIQVVEDTSTKQHQQQHQQRQGQAHFENNPSMIDYQCTEKAALMNRYNLTELPLCLFVGTDPAPQDMQLAHSIDTSTTTTTTTTAAVSTAPLSPPVSPKKSSDELPQQDGAPKSPRLPPQSPPSNKITVAIQAPPTLYYNTYLTILILDTNKITVIPRTITLFPNLIELSISSNLLTDIPEYLCELTMLQSLRIGQNPFPSFPLNVCKLTSLTELYFESNNIDTLPQDILHLTRLKVLSLEENRFTSIPEYLPATIERLNLSGNDISFIESGTLPMSLLTNLTVLNLSENQLTKIDDSFVLLSNLKTLLLDCNMITHLPGNVVQGWQALSSLNIPHNELTTLPAEIAFLPNLSVLDVRGNCFEHTKSAPAEVSSTSAFKLEDFISDKESFNLLKLTSDLNSHLASTSDEFGGDNSAGAGAGGDNSSTTTTGALSTTAAAPRINVQIGGGIGSQMSAPLIFWQSISADQIIDGVFLGCKESATNKRFLLDNNITHILTVAHFKPLYPKLFKYKVIDIDDVDYENIAMYFNEMNEFIDEAVATGGVLIHCRAGVSRSATATMAYIMYKQKLSFDEAFSITAKGRPRICPNNGFVAQLKEYGIELASKQHQQQQQQSPTQTHTQVEHIEVVTPTLVVEPVLLQLP